MTILQKELTAMNKKVLIVSSSPRKHGNSDLLCDEFARGAKDAGNEVEKVFLADNVMCPVRTVQFQRTNWAKNNQLQPITYEFCIAV